MEPILLPANQPRERFYRGGERIARFRGEQAWEPNTPEDWVASTTSVRGAEPLGITQLPDGRLLTDAIATDPLPWLGSQHVDRFGTDTKLLVKLLDAGQRLPVHAHPDGMFAAEHVGASHGKAEAWYILTPGTVHLGLKRDVTIEELRTLVDAQDSEGMLALMHELAVEPGDCVYVPPGVLHSIGEGILLAEVQEPEDLSILLEWRDFALDGQRDGHLGIGFDVALTAVERAGRTVDNAESLVRRAVVNGAALVPEAEQYFRLDHVADASGFPAGLAIIIALADASLATRSGEHALRSGSTTLVPFAAGDFAITGSALVARPPVG